jgi:hypothetical protein
VGNNATEAKTRTARTGVLNVFVSQFIIGIISCKILSHYSGRRATKLLHLSKHFHNTYEHFFPNLLVSESGDIGIYQSLG